MLLNNTFAALNNSIVNQKETNKSLNKLSSGLKINKAGDDASGLAIADKLRTHASGIKQSIANSNSAVALLQITDKAMDEISNILDIVKTKLIQAHTHTTSDNGRKAIKKDIEKLLSQIDNIANQTTYNDIKLLAHSGLDFQVGVTGADTVSVSDIYTSVEGLSGVKYKDNSSYDVNSLEAYSKRADYTNSSPFTSANLLEDGFQVPATSNTKDILSNEIRVDSNSTTAFDININTSNFQDMFTYNGNTQYTNLRLSGTYIFPDNESTKSYFQAFADTFTIGRGDQIEYKTDSVLGEYFYVPNTYSYSLNSEQIGSLDPILSQTQNLKFRASRGSVDLRNVIANRIEPQDLVLQTVTTETIGGVTTYLDTPRPVRYDHSITPNNESILNTWVTDLSNLTQVNPNASGLCGTLEDLKNMAIDSFTFECAGNFQETADYALTLLNKYRSEAGSTQVQLESITRNLLTGYVNTKNAESTIRDVDYASESANFNKLNIIGQAGSFAQVERNEIQQRVLDLLR